MFLLVDSNVNFSNVKIREYYEIKVAESMVSGYRGYQEHYNFSVIQGDQSVYPVTMTLNIKWSITQDSFESAIEAGGLNDPVGLVRKLPGLIFQVGHYYWHFCSQFYQWAAIECLDPDVRYWGKLLN